MNIVGSALGLVMIGGSAGAVYYLSAQHEWVLYGMLGFAAGLWCGRVLYGKEDRPSLKKELKEIRGKDNA